MKTFTQEITYDGECVSRVTFAMIPNDTRVEVHHEVYKWTPGIFKEHVLLWARTLETLKSVGVTQVMTICPKESFTKKVGKYWTLFGFSNIKEREIFGKPYLCGEMEVV